MMVYDGPTMSSPTICHHKLTFDSLAAAKAAAISLRHQHGEKLYVYQCHNCGLWHLSSNSD